MSRMTIFAVAALLVLVTPALAHETGVVKLSSKRVDVGGGLSLRGEKMPKSSKVRIELRGALATLALGEVTTDTAGVFETNIIVPETAKPGNYKLVVLAEDGDITARADLIIAEATPSTDMKGHEGMAHQPMAQPEATDEMMPLNAKFTAAELSIIGLIVVGALVGGLTMLRRGAVG